MSLKKFIRFSLKDKIESQAEKEKEAQAPIPTVTSTDTESAGGRADTKPDKIKKPRDKK